MKKTNILHNNKGFTMIEMLIVIILIGFVITFLFNYLGNAFKGAASQQAASKISDDMRTISDAGARYQMEQATNATALTGVATALDTKLSSSGTPYIVTIPSPPTTGTTTGTAYTWDATAYTGWGTSAPDSVITLPGITSIDVCEQINSQFAGIAANTTPPTSVDIKKGVQCFGSGPYTALKPVYIN